MTQFLKRDGWTVQWRPYDGKSPLSLIKLDHFLEQAEAIAARNGMSGVGSVFEYAADNGDQIHIWRES